MKKIYLTQGKYALVDDTDFEELNKYKWCARKGYNNFYAGRNIRLKDGKKSVILMHRQIMQTPKGMVTDHKNHNGLDNRRENLRICTYSENMRNQKSNKNTRSKYKGISLDAVGKKYESRIWVNKKYLYLGRYNTEKEAAIVYNEAAVKYYGEFALLNEIDN